MLSETFLLYGQSEPPPMLIPLRAGPLTLLYDPAGGMVRRIMLGEIEVLRGIYAAVRDRNWGTVPGAIRELNRRVDKQTFQIEFESEHRQGDIHFTWRGNIRGGNDGSLRYEFDGTAKTTFLRNRIGFCVLHPILECAGARVRQFRMDGSRIDGCFPDRIEPQLIGRGSIRDLRRLAHEVKPGLWAEVEFEGDIFETEDQRNWTDASFKTYCTPLAEPFPVEVKTGTSIRQTVTLKLAGEAAGADRVAIEVEEQRAEPVLVGIPESPEHRFPALGLGLASHGETLNEAEILSLKKLRPAHLRVDIRLGDKDSLPTLRRAVIEAGRLNAGLELALHLSREGETDPAPLLQILNQSAAPLSRILALRQNEQATSRRTLVWVRKNFGAFNVPIGAGSDCNFCELNREHAMERLPLEEADFLFWSVNPQVHAFDHLSLMETLAAQAATVQTARDFAGGRPLVISPLTLKQRFNPVATSTNSVTATHELPAPVDARQLSQFAAAWTLGSLAALASAGADSVTYFETTGWRGVMERSQGSPLPQQFPSTPGKAFPLFNVFSAVAGVDNVAAGHSNSPGRLAVLGLFAGKQLKQALVANLTASPQVAMVAGLTNERSSLKLKAFEVLTIGAPE